jgi:hypothetical protein
MAPLFIALVLYASQETTWASKFPLCQLQFQFEQTCQIALGEEYVFLRRDGLIIRPDNLALQIPLPPDFHFEVLRSYEAPSDSYFVAQITDGESKETLVVRIGLAPLALKWTVDVPSYNASMPAIEDDGIYIATLDSLAKLDPVRGRIVWINRYIEERDFRYIEKHGESGNPSFEKPVRNGDTVVFVENRAVSRRFVVDDRSGKILSR